MNNFTIKAQEALQNAHNLAMDNGQQQVDTPHLMISLISQEEGVVLALLKKKVLQSKILQLNSLNNLKNLSFKYTIKHIVLAKLNKNILNSNNNLNYNTYFYLK